MTGSALVLAAGLNWIDVVVLIIFALGIVLVLLVPFTIDVRNTHREYGELVKADPATAAKTELRGVQGLARSTMAFGVIAVIGFALAYILVARPFSDNKTVVNTIVVALTTTLASITAFYFGTRLASQAHENAAAALTAGAGLAAPSPAAEKATFGRLKSDQGGSMSAEEEPEPEEVDDEFDPFAEHPLDTEPEEGDEGDDNVHSDS